MLPKEKHKPATNSLIYNGVLPAKSANAVVAQILWGQPTNVWFDLRPLKDETHAWLWLGDQEPEIR